MISLPVMPRRLLARVCYSAGWMMLDSPWRLKWTGKLSVARLLHELIAALYGRFDITDNHPTLRVELYYFQSIALCCTPPRTYHLSSDHVTGPGRARPRTTQQLHSCCCCRDLKKSYAGRSIVAEIVLQLLFSRCADVNVRQSITTCRTCSSSAEHQWCACMPQIKRSSGLLS